MSAIASSPINSLCSLLRFAVYALLLLVMFSTAVRAQYTTAADGSGGLIITQYTGLGGAVAIPSTINNLPVTSIGNYSQGIGPPIGAFQGTNVTSVTIPTGVTSIQVFAFYGCTSLTSVTIPATVTSISFYAFEGCSSLTSMMFSAPNTAYSSLGGVLFNQDQTTLIEFPGNASTYTIPSSVTTIGDYAFSYCGNLTSVTIPNSVTTIGAGAFDSCSSLTSAVFLGSAPTMGGYCFDGDASGFTVYSATGATGFTSPTWTPDANDSYPAAVDPIIGASTGNNLYDSPWFGYYTATAYPLVYEYNLGYEYVFPSGAGVYLYDYTSGHFWYTQSTYFPFVYDFTLNAFLYYYQVNTPHRHFYDYGTNAVITE